MCIVVIKSIQTINFRGVIIAVVLHLHELCTFGDTDNVA